MYRTICTVTFFLFTVIAYSQDTNPPILTGFSFSPSSIDLANKNLNVTFSLSASDELSEIKRVSVSFSNDDAAGSMSTTFNNIKDKNFNDSKTLNLPNNSEPGNWSVSITLEDNEKNSISYSKSDLEALGFASSLQVTQTIINDETPPTLTGFSFSPSLIELPGEALINYSISAADEGSGVNSIIISLAPEHGGGKTERIRDINSNSANISGFIDLGKNPSPGIWTVSISVSDYESNEVNYSQIDLQNSGYSSSLEVKELADSTPPEIINFSFSPSILNIGSADTYISVSITARDLGSELDNINIDFIPAENGGGQSLRFSKIDEETATLSGEINFKNAKPGQYWVNVSLKDSERNSISYSADELGNLGFPNSLIVVISHDTAAPVITDFSLSCDTVEINSMQNITDYFIRVEDSSSEIKQVNINFISPGNGNGESINFNNIRNTVLESSGELEFKKNSKQGLWEIEIEVEDVAKNKFIYTEQILEKLGFPSGIFLTATKDTLPPALLNLSLTPESLNANDPSLIAFSISAVDDLSGIDAVEISIGNKKTRVNKIDSTYFNYSSFVDLNKNINADELEISISMRDRENNNITLSSQELIDMGFPGKISVIDNCFIELLYPTGIETIYSGDDLSIEWKFGGVKKVKLSYSTDSGNSWNEISSNINAERKSFSWKANFSEDTEIMIQLTDSDNENIFDVSSCFFSVMGTTDIFDSDELPNVTKLYQNYPNPFNPSTEIHYSLEESGDVVISIFNSLGEKISEPLNGWKSAGRHSIEFNSHGLPSGIYFYILRTGNYFESKKMLLVK